MENKHFDWNLPADPDLDPDNYFNGTVSAHASEEVSNKIIRAIKLAVFLRDDLKSQADVILAVGETVREIVGVPELTRRDMLMLFVGFKTSNTLRLIPKGDYK